LRSGVAVVRIAELHHGSMAEVDLVFEAAEVLARVESGGGGVGAQRPKTDQSFVIHIHKKIGEPDMGGREVPLKMQQIGVGPAPASVLASGKAGDDGLVVFGMESVGEPGAAADEGAGNTDSWVPVAEMKPMLDAQAGDEIGSGEAEGVRTVFGVDGEGPGGAFAKLGRRAAGGKIQPPNAFDAPSSL